MSVGILRADSDGYQLAIMSTFEFSECTPLFSMSLYNFHTT